MQSKRSQVNGASSGSQTQAFFSVSWAPKPRWALVGVSLSCVRYPVLGFSQPKGLSFVPCPNRSGSSDALGELANGYDRVESGSVVCDGVDIALL